MAGGFVRRVFDSRSGAQWLRSERFTSPRKLVDPDETPYCLHVLPPFSIRLPSADFDRMSRNWVRSRGFWWGTWPLKRSLVVAIVDSNPTITTAISLVILDAN
jgi:hypothetical protein